MKTEGSVRTKSKQEMMLTVEGVTVKLPYYSFPILRSPVRHATVNLRPFSVSASTLKEGHSETPSAAPTSISLGHLTRPDFPILHQVCLHKYRDVDI